MDKIAQFVVTFPLTIKFVGSMPHDLGPVTLADSRF